MSNDNPYTPPSTQSISNKPTTKANELQGIGGWLTLVAIMVCLSPLRIAFYLYNDLYKPVITTDVWSMLTDPTSQHYIAAFKLVFIVEFLLNILMILVWLYLAFLFFSKKRLFKKLFIGILIITPIILITDTLVTSQILNAPAFDEEIFRELFRGIFAALIWITYTLKSKRVSNTFIH